MAPVVETVKTINSFLRTLVAMVAVGLITVASWLGYQNFNASDIALAEKEAALSQAKEELESQRAKTVAAEQRVQQQQQEIATLNADVVAKTAEIANQKIEIERLDTALTFLKINHRLAEITVVDQGTDEKSGEDFSVIEFVEVNDEGAPIDRPRRFRIRGDIVYIDYWIVKFEDQYIETSDLDRSTSICLFRRIFGEFQQPQEGYVLDEVGVRPTAYARGGKASAFEQKIWDDFWNIANDQEKAKRLGIRAAHGEADYTKLQKGKKYKIELRASGGLTIKPGEATAGNKAPL
jgi:hypothetical protein